MIGSSKILTVSYGTFSCTLEGFDDSFSTMKAIAEYFRDLAADDRYFGAEPPTPDAEMLARIAERETTRRVEARTSPNGIVLRAASAMDADVDDSDDAIEDTPAPVVKADIETSAPAQIADVAPEPTVAKVADQAPVTAPEIAMPPQVQRPLSVAELPATLRVTPQAAPITKAPVAKLTFEDMDPSAAVKVAPAHPDADSVAAKLQRIRAITGKAFVRPSAYVEDQHARDASPISTGADEVYETDLSATEAFFDTPKSIETDVSEVDLSAEESTEFDVTEDVVLEADVEETADDQIEDVTPDEAITSEMAEESQEDIAADLVDMERLDGVADEQTDVAAETDIAQTAPLDDDAVEDAPVAEEVAPATEVDKPSIRARIVRLRKGIPLGGGEIEADETAKVANDQPESAEATAVDAEDDDRVSEVSADDSSEVNADQADEIVEVAEASDETGSELSPEDEAELLEELADVARDIEETPEPVHAVRHTLPKNDDDTMSRIMNQTDKELGDPDNSRRRNAIAQLKAAVVATEAARQLGDKSDHVKEDEDAFRKDLDQVVRPRRPARVELEEARTERPRPAPLKLVASQRVDKPATENAAPVQPRRIATIPIDASIPSDSASFAEFAAKMGATELPDLLEAAAAYTAFVEGSVDFSRPQIMKKVQLTVDQEFSREDGLRSFGTLLRQGRISKVRNGRFQISDQTRFRPESRVARG